MAAVTLDANQQHSTLRVQKAKAEGKPIKGQKKEKGKHKQVKNVLLPSKTKLLTSLEESVENDAIDKLKQALEKFSMPKEKAGTKRKQPACEEEVNRKKTLRSQVVFGINCVTKSLEKDQLRLAITCTSADPPILTKHIIELAATRKCVAICIKNLKEILSEKLNFSSIAIGFLKIDDTGTDDFKEFIDHIQSIVPKPWESVEDSNQIEHKVQDLETRTVQDIDMKINVEHQKDITLKERETIEEQEPPDYSRFYIYKADSKTGFKNGKVSVPNFIAIQSDIEEEEMMNGDETVKNRYKFGTGEIVEYVPINVGVMQQNENKAKKQKKEKKSKKKK